jgi:hypothetical protein
MIHKRKENPQVNKDDKATLAKQAIDLIGEGDKRGATIAIAQLLGYRTAKIKGLWYIKTPDGTFLSPKMFSASERPEQEAWEDLFLFPRWLDSLEIAGGLPMPESGKILLEGKASGTKVQILFEDGSIAGEAKHSSPSMALTLAWLNMVETHIKWSPQRELLSEAWL